ncbi:glycosyltransferase family 8 protein [Leptolyngbya sp. FACHB-711]|uniref:glycosyltransferase family 8 protein n=1 Tax=unclassified Leptolyngbya TaxID=2650499 RepID=UPI002411301E|nr:glycosyltransferase family 8 protein [Leptolyngbya sp. FACHB-711]
MQSHIPDAQPIVVVCSADEIYAMPLTVTIYSVLSNLASKATKILLFIMDGGIKKATKRKIESSLRSNQLEIQWIQIDRNQYKNLPELRYLTVAAYYRLLVTEVLPKEFEKVIYLDSDMVVLGPLEELWQVELGDKPVLAIRNGYPHLFSLVPGLSNYKELGLNPDSLYFNSGLLVINLQKWREDRIGAKALEFIEQNRATIHDPDQDALNAVLEGQWGELDPRWNQMPQIYEFSDWKESPFDDPETYQSVLDDPLIVHYAISKPWHLACNHPAIPLFEHYLDQTAWAGVRDTRLNLFIRKVKREIRSWRNSRNENYASSSLPKTASESTVKV